MRDALFLPKGARLGTDARALVRPRVLVLDGAVAHCDPRPPDGVPEGVPRIEGGWLAEPLADAHVHLFLPGTLDASVRRATAGASQEAALERALGVLGLCRRLGIAAVRDGGDPRGLALEAARVANGRPGRYAAVLPAGEPVFRRGQYGSFLGQGVELVREVRGLLARNRSEGATHVKLLATGLNSLEEPGRVGQVQFAPAELSEIRAAAEHEGLRLMVHANGALGPLRPLLGRPATLEHGFWLAEGDEHTLAELGTVWVPTLSAWSVLSGRLDLSASGRAVVATTDERHRQEVARGSAAGVPVAAGSDAGTPGVEHGQGLLRELKHLGAAGLGAQGALAAAFRSRRLCEAEAGKEFGGLTTGRPAGFSLLREDPVTNPDALQTPVGVWLGGEWTPCETATGREA